MMKNNPYQILGINKSASEAEIKSAFRHLAKETHPDLNGGNQQLTERFRTGSEAYAILSDPTKKEEVDYLIREGSQTQGNYSSSVNSDIKATAHNIEHCIHQMYEQVKPAKKQAIHSLWVGLAWLSIGLIISAISYLVANSNGGGTYFVAYGAIIFGGIQAVKSFYCFIKINIAVIKYKSEMWKSIGI
jgi:hypothetical protein